MFHLKFKKMSKLISWVEIPATDINRAVNFYNAILKLSLEVLDFGKEKMACFPGDEGAISYAEGFTPSKNGVLVSFSAGSDLDNVLNRVVENGGEVIIPKTKIEAEGRGYFATFTDSEGNRLGLYGEL